MKNIWGEAFMSEILDRICFNCSNFFTDVNDLGSNLGVCIKDEAFEEYLDEIFENSDFSLCIDLYKEKSFDGERDVCADYEEVEIIEDEESENGSQMTEEELDRRADALRTQDVSDIAGFLYGEEKEKNKAISALLYLMNFNNKNAFDTMLNYYKNLPPVESIDDVHFRLKILERFYRFNTINGCSNELIEMLVDELYKMNSNNTTRQLFSSILKFLSSSDFESDIVIDKLVWLLNNRKFSPKMEQNILSVIQKRESKGSYWFLNN